MFVNDVTDDQKFMNKLYQSKWTSPIKYTHSNLVSIKYIYVSCLAYGLAYYKINHAYGLSEDKFLPAISKQNEFSLLLIVPVEGSSHLWKQFDNNSLVKNFLFCN